MRAQAPPLRQTGNVLLERIWEKHQRLFKSIVLTIIRNPEDVEDVLQETYRRLLNKPRNIKDPDEAFYYLKKSVRNTSIDWNRKMFRRNLTVKEQVSNYERLEELRTSPDNPLSNLLEKEKMAFDSRFIKEARSIVDELPEKFREAVKSYFQLDGYPPPGEFYDKRNIAYSTLRSRMERGIDLIRIKISEKMEPNLVKSGTQTLLRLKEKRASE